MDVTEELSDTIRDFVPAKKKKKKCLEKRKIFVRACFVILSRKQLCLDRETLLASVNQNISQNLAINRD